MYKRQGPSSTQAATLRSPPAAKSTHHRFTVVTRFICRTLRFLEEGWGKRAQHRHNPVLMTKPERCARFCLQHNASHHGDLDGVRSSQPAMLVIFARAVQPMRCISRGRPNPRAAFSVAALDRGVPAGARTGDRGDVRVSSREPFAISPCHQAYASAIEQRSGSADDGAATHRSFEARSSSATEPRPQGPCDPDVMAAGAGRLAGLMLPGWPPREALQTPRR